MAKEKQKSRGRYYADLLEVNGRFINKSSLLYWTKLALDCYKRGCNCENCNLLPKIESKDFICRIKDYVIGYFKLGVYPPNAEDETNNT